MNILVFDTSLKNPNYYITEAILNALKVSSACSHTDIATTRNLTNKACLEEWDLLLAVGGNDFDWALFKNNAIYFKKTALWTTEDPYQLESNIKVAHYFDYIFTNEFSAVEKYLLVNKNSYFLPLGGDHFNSIKPQINESAMKYDVFFVGTLWPNRVDILTTIAKELGDTHKIKFGFPKNQFLETALKNSNGILTDWTLGPQDYLQTINLSKLTVALPRDFSSRSRKSSKGDTPPPRVYETGIAGGVLVYPDSAISSDFPLAKDKEFISFANSTELIKKIKMNCNDWTLRSKLAKSLQKKILKSETYLNRINFLLDQISSPLKTSKISKFPTNIKGPKNIAIFTHNMKGNGNWGGVEVYQEVLKKLPDCNVFFLWKSNNNFYAQLPSTEIICFLNLAEINLSNLIYDRKIEIHLANFLAEHEIEIIHFQHLISFPAVLPIYFKKLGYKVIFTLHDYHSICHKFNLLDYQDKFCSGGSSGTHCEVCNLASGVSKYSTLRRRNLFQEIFDSIDVVIFPSQTAKDLHTKIYNIDNNKVRILPIPLISKSANFRSRLNSRLEGNVLELSSNFSITKNNQDLTFITALIPGNFSKNKGADDLIYLMNTLRSEKIKFKIIGRIDTVYEDRLKLLNFENLSIVGQYDSNNLDDHIKDVDLAIVWPQWPETYLMTVDEMLAYNIPVISNSLGAQIERLKKHSHGILVNNLYDLIDKLRTFIIEPDKIRHFKQIVPNQNAHTTKGEHLKSVSEIYTEISSSFKYIRVPPTSFLALSCNHDLKDLGLPFSNKYFTSDEIIINNNSKSASTTLNNPKSNQIIENHFSNLDKEELLDKIDAILENTDSSFLSNIDMINERPFIPNSSYSCLNQLAISGWATHEKGSSLSDEVILCFATNSSEFTFFSGERTSRQDVGVKFSNDALSNSGFIFRIPANNLIFNENLEIFIFINSPHSNAQGATLIGEHIGSILLNKEDQSA